ncbi:hypothetical protein FHL15_008452 [Xylaria flabelliformis]|uniref:Uncharacterized protein n=1 Tax=Xylaria flabelliformis TaxID=2512241 RepID=A0A553HRT9_9PEZI|nr:hypothetical protein FHL15_008452 [Xylaria flabelliformis]
MERQSVQGSVLSKQHCPSHQFAPPTPILQPPMSQTEQYLYDGNQIYGGLTEQPAQNSYYYNNNNFSNTLNNYYGSNYNYTSSTNNSAANQNTGLLQENNIANGWNEPMQLTPSQFTLGKPTYSQSVPLQCVPANFKSAPLTTAQFTVNPTDVNTNPNTTLRVNSPGNNIFSSYPTHVPDFISERGFPMQNQWQNQWDSEALCNPAKPNQPAFNIQQYEPRPNRPENRTTAVSVNAKNDTSWTSLRHSRLSACENQVPNPPKRRRQTAKRRQPQDDSDLVDLVGKTTRTPQVPTQRLPTPRPVTNATPAPSKPTTESAQLPNPKETQGDIALCKVSNYEDTLETGFGELSKHLKDLEQQEAQAKMAQREKEREEAENQRTEVFEWPGDPSEYPAECFANMRLPGCEFRAHAICIGSPRPGLSLNKYNAYPKGRLVVYAVRQGSDGVEFKLVEPHSTPKQVMQASTIRFEDIKLSTDFSDMNEPKVIRWSRYLLDAVPGQNDSVTMWSKA